MSIESILAGRTGRAGRKGTAFTFLQPNEAQYAPDLCRALKDAKQPDHITPDLKALADEFNKKVRFVCCYLSSTARGAVYPDDLYFIPLEHLSTNQ